jgi:hypothetical protein
MQDEGGRLAHVSLPPLEEPLDEELETPLDEPLDEPPEEPLDVPDELPLDELENPPELLPVIDPELDPLAPSGPASWVMAETLPPHAEPSESTANGRPARTSESAPRRRWDMGPLRKEPAWCRRAQASHGDGRVQSGGPT